MGLPSQCTVCILSVASRQSPGLRARGNHIKQRTETTDRSRRFGEEWVGYPLPDRLWVKIALPAKPHAAENENDFSAFRAFYLI